MYRSFIATHKGWFLFCPVWIKDVDSDFPPALVRGPCPHWVFYAASHIHDFINWSGCVLLYDEWVPFYGLWVQELETPTLIEYECEH